MPREDDRWAHLSDAPDLGQDLDQFLVVRIEEFGSGKPSVGKP